MVTRSDSIEVEAFQLKNPSVVYVLAAPGEWLLKRTTPSWRIRDPEKGFQRIVQEKRARQIALSVLDRQRTFPNAIILATDTPKLEFNGSKIILPSKIRFLIVDGQHRLWAQKFSNYKAEYACVIHLGLTEVEMAKLFLEINDNQKRVPSSLRWDLVRLVRPEDDPYAVAAGEAVFLLASDEQSPLYQRIDLTGEQSEIKLKQGSIAPELKPLFSKQPLSGLSFDQQYQVILQYLIAIREINKHEWITGESPFYRARVLRPLLKLLPEILKNSKKDPTEVMYSHFLPYLKRINKSSLEDEAIRAVQGAAGMKEIYDQIKTQIFN